MKASLKTTKLTLGQLGEKYAAAYLQQLDFLLVAANFTVPVGRNRQHAIINAELDLIAYDGPTLCFVEVKTRASDWFATPEVNVDKRKRRQIARAAREYRRMFGIADEPYRYDVVTVILEGTNALCSQIEVLKNFWREEDLRKRYRSERYYD